MQETGEIASISVRFGDYHTLFSYLLPQKRPGGEGRERRSERQESYH